MHQIQFQLGFCPISHWGELTALPRPHSWTQEILLIRKQWEEKGDRKRVMGGRGVGEYFTSPLWLQPRSATAVR